MEMNKVGFIFLFYIIVAVAKADNSSDNSSTNQSLAENFRQLQEQAEKILTDFSQDCKELHNATEDDIIAMVKNHKDASYNSMCVRMCMLQNFDLMSTDGKFCPKCLKNVAEIFIADQDDILTAIEEIAETCSKSDEKDMCKAAFNYGMCINDEAEERFFKSNM